MGNGYHTKQRDMILSCLKSFGDDHFTVDDVFDRLQKTDETVGKTTVYRYLYKLLSDSVVRKYSINDGKMAFFQYVGDKDCEHFHLKCVSCGKLICAECQHLNQVSEHILSHHHFAVDQKKTVFYGLCSECKKGKNKE